MTPTPSVAALWRYPIRGLGGQAVETAALRPGRGIQGDRCLALQSAGGSFLTLREEARLAQLVATLEDDSRFVTIERQGRQVARGHADSPMGRLLLLQFLAAFLARPGAPPKLVVDSPRPPSQVTPLISLINLASLVDLERVARGPVDPKRFRANLWIEGLPAWGEQSWVGRRLRLGEVELLVLGEIERCQAAAINPDSGERDLNLPLALQRGFGHSRVGLYARVEQEGTLACGQALSLL